MTTSGARWVAFGNPTRNTGAFRECFGKFRHRWVCRQIDSRTAKMVDSKRCSNGLTTTARIQTSFACGCVANSRAPAAISSSLARMSTTALNTKQFQSTPLVVEGRCASPVTREFHEEKGPCCANLLEKRSANHTECGDCRWKCFCINRLRRPRTCRGSAGTCGSRALFRQPAVHQNLSP